MSIYDLLLKAQKNVEMFLDAEQKREEKEKQKKRIDNLCGEMRGLGRTSTSILHRAAGAGIGQKE